MKQGRDLSLHGDRDDRVIDQKKSILYGIYKQSVDYFRARSAQHIPDGTITDTCRDALLYTPFAIAIAMYQTHS